MASVKEAVPQSFITLESVEIVREREVGREIVSAVTVTASPFQSSIFMKKKVILALKWGTRPVYVFSTELPDPKLPGPPTTK